MTDNELREVRKLAMRLLDITEEQAGEIGLSPETPVRAVSEAPNPAVVNDREVLLNAARRELARRRVRRDHLPSELFAEGGWNMLLDLFDQHHRERAVSITSACMAADVPASTALRHLEHLVHQGLVARDIDPRDRRRCFVRLTPKGDLSVRLALAAQIESETPPVTSIFRFTVNS